MSAHISRPVLLGQAGELIGYAGSGRDQVGMGVGQTPCSECALLEGGGGFCAPSPLSCGLFLAQLQPHNSPGLPGCVALPDGSAGQSLKAVRCDGTDWQLGSHARG